MRSVLLASTLALLHIACAPTSAPPAATPQGAMSAAPATSTPSVASADVAPHTAAVTTPPIGPAGPVSPAAATSPPQGREPDALRDALGAAARATAAGDATGADRAITAAATLAGQDAHSVYLVARARATRFVYAGDFEHAAGALTDVMPLLAGHPELPDEFWLHNAMMMIREAQGDPAAALVEDDEATLCASRGTWDPEDRETLAFQKDRWHRAYLTRMLAESRSGSVKQALVEYARRALQEYRGRGFPDSVAVLEAYFAALDGNREAALAAAHSVDPAKDDDVEDLYLVVVGFESGGAHAAAEAVRRVMRRPGGASMSRAIMLRWLDLDAHAPSAGAFTPWHAARAPERRPVGVPPSSARDERAP
jgi:hypothetical protein